MRTPAGTECPFFYGDYRRGRNREECRLIGNVPPPKNWKRDLCARCPVPGIVQANACQNMELTAEVQPGFLRIGRKVNVNAYCHKCETVVAEPHIGCGQCHELPDIFTDQIP